MTSFFFRNSKFEIRTSKFLDLVAALVLALVTAALYRKIIRLWWTYDDPFHLRRVKVYDTLALFFDVPLWHGIPARVFTPLLLASMRADYLLFGLDGRAFYIHQLIAFTLIPVTLYFLLRLWLTRAWAFAASLLVIMGPPMIQIAQQLMLRHYVEGLPIAFGSAALAVLAFRRDDRRFSIASALLYLIAVSAKEVFVPLPFLLAIIPEPVSTRGARASHPLEASRGRGARAPLGGLWIRLRHLVPHGVVVILYTIWRTVMLGHGVRPYGWTIRAADWPPLLLRVPYKVLRQFVATGGAAGVVMVVALLACIALAVIRLRGAWLVAAMAAGAAVLPIVPLAVDMKVRFGLMSWIVAVIGAAFVSRAAPRIAPALFAVLLISALIVQRHEWATTYRDMRRMSDEARVIVDLGENDIVREPLTPPPTMDELIALYGAKGRALYDDRRICDGSLPIRRIFTYDPGMHIVREVQHSDFDAACRELKVMPLTVDLNVEDGVLFWNLGPYRDGQYSFVLRDGFQAFDVRPRLGYRLENVPLLPLIVRYRSPQGWTTYSPELRVSFEHPAPIHWERK
jgi:hypothetical protein